MWRLLVRVSYVRQVCSITDTAHGAGFEFRAVKSQKQGDS